MSIIYDQYLKEHIENVNRGFHWMVDNLPLTKLGFTDVDIQKAEDNLILGHDRSKSDSQEYYPYDAYFYGGNRSYQVVRDFDYAWLRHQHLNPHHWQHWILINDDDGTNRALEIPGCYILEMVADWWSFSWKREALNEVFTWYEEHLERMLLHPKSRLLIEKLLDVMEEKLYESDSEKVLAHSELSDAEVERRKYAIPDERKFPMPDADHVRSAIRFFNYVEPKYEEQLARAILKRMKEYGLTFDDIAVGDKNRFKKYIPKEEEK